jgi:uncharacterized protein YggE
MDSHQRARLAVDAAVLTVVAFAGVPMVGTVGAQAGNDSTPTDTPTPTDEPTEPPAEPAAESTTITVSATGQASADPDVVVVRVESAATTDSPADAAAGTTIDGGPVSVEVSVTITYEAQPR